MLRTRNFKSLAVGARADCCRRARPTRGSSSRAYIRYDRFESERSDKLTGGRIEKAEFEAGQPDIKLTLNVPRSASRSGRTGAR